MEDPAETPYRPFPFGRGVADLNTPEQAQADGAGTYAEVGCDSPLEQGGRDHRVTVDPTSPEQAVGPGRDPVEVVQGEAAAHDGQRVQGTQARRPGSDSTPAATRSPEQSRPSHPPALVGRHAPGVAGVRDSASDLVFLGEAA